MTREERVLRWWSWMRRRCSSLSLILQKLSNSSPGAMLSAMDSAPLDWSKCNQNFGHRTRISLLWYHKWWESNRVSSWLLNCISRIKASEEAPRCIEATTSIQVSPSVRPLMIVGQDQSVFSQYLLSSKQLIGPKGQVSLLPKLEGDKKFQIYFTCCRCAHD